MESEPTHIRWKRGTDNRPPASRWADGGPSLTVGNFGSAFFSRLWQLVMVIIVLFLTVLLLRKGNEVQYLQKLALAQRSQISVLQEWSNDAVVQFELLDRYRIPYRYLTILKDACEENNLNLAFMVALMQIESHYNANAQSNKNAFGLMQLQFPTALDLDPDLQSHYQLFDPKKNIHLGARYFRGLLDRYDGDYRLAAVAYNRGPSRLDRELDSEQELIDEYYRMIMAAQVEN